jgi:hypothetical protein
MTRTLEALRQSRRIGEALAASRWIVPPHHAWTRPAEQAGRTPVGEVYGLVAAESDISSFRLRDRKRIS